MSARNHAEIKKPNVAPIAAYADATLDSKSIEMHSPKDTAFETVRSRSHDRI
jgi:hypothetical protein